MFRVPRNYCVVMLGTGFLAGALVGVGMLIGVLVAASFSPVSGQTALEERALTERLLHASSASIGKQMAIATGQVYEGAEGLFVLDFLTGDLYCYVLNPRDLLAGYIGVFKTNVVQDLGIEKGKTPDYVLATGNISALRGAAAAQPANCVCYVADGSTGRIAAYSLGYNRTLANSGRPQSDALIRLALVKARPDIERSQ